MENSSRTRDVAELISERAERLPRNSAAEPSHVDNTLHERGRHRSAADSRRKDEFLAMLSHELRSPLASIRHAARVLGSPRVETSTRQKAQALIERQIGQMARFVDDLMDVSRLTTGHLCLRCKRIDLRVVVGDSIEALQSAISERRQRLTTALPGEPLWLHGDPGRLEQVCVNLLTNASRYTDTGGELSIHLYAQRAQAVISFRDAGIGIAPQVLPHIFDLFMQADPAASRPGSGLGVGLALVRDLVELHGGSVTAASAGPGQGSEFTVRLPVQAQGTMAAD